MARLPDHPSGPRSQVSLHLSPYHLGLLDALVADKGYGRNQVIERLLERASGIGVKAPANKIAATAPAAPKQIVSRPKEKWKEK